jgi:hypothetical protein
MWWCYFSGDDDRADERFTRTAAQQRPYIALTAFGVDHTITIFGLVVFAAGVKFAIVDVFAVAPQPTAWLLAGGVALYLLGACAAGRLSFVAAVVSDQSPRPLSPDTGAGTPRPRSALARSGSRSSASAPGRRVVCAVHRPSRAPQRTPDPAAPV